jgi:uncharacterized membrane protein
MPCGVESLKVVRVGEATAARTRLAYAQRENCRGRSSVPRTGVVVLAVDTGVVVIVVAVAVVLVVLIAAVSMRGRQRRGAQRRGEERRQLDEAAEERSSRAHHEHDVAREDGEN